MEGLLNNHIQQRKAAILAGFGIDIQKSNDDELQKGGVGSGRKRGQLVQIGKKIGSYVATYHGKAENEVGDKHVVTRGGERRIVRHDEIYDHPKHNEVNTDEKVAQRAKFYDDEAAARKKNKLKKSSIDDFQKANGGEGSRGGKVIGHTKSGKPIYDSSSHSAHSNFTSDDHKEAAKIHFDKLKEYQQKYKKAKKEGSGMGSFTFKQKLNKHDKEGAAHMTAATK